MGLEDQTKHAESKRMKTFCLLLLLLSAPVRAQHNLDALRKGNTHYHAKEFDKASAEYEKAYGTNAEDARAPYNWGNALYGQNNWEEAARKYQSAAALAKDPKAQARAYHNLGNVWLKQQKPEEAVKAFEQALYRNPSDEDTRYNLAYAQRLVKQQEKEKQDQKGDDEEKKKEEQEQPKKQEQERKEQQEARQPKEQLSKEDGERMLDAMQREEKEVQEKVLEKKQEPKRRPVEKDW
jgi:Ca-activated chloride channel homolog